MVNFSNPVNQTAAGGGQRRMTPLKAGDFAGALGGAISREGAKQPLGAVDFVPGAKVLEGKHEQLTHTAQKWVAQTFYGAMLKQMRNSPFKSELFNGGRGGEAYAAMFDQTLAERMARGQDNKLVRSIVRQILKHNEQKAEGRDRPAAHRAGEKSSDNPFEKVRVHVAPAR